MTGVHIGIVGAGGLASGQIYPHLASVGIQLAAVCDLDLEKARAKTQQYGGDAYDDFDTMLAKAKLDGVILCVGPEFHATGALKVLQAGLPVYTEKPPAVCADDLLPVVELAKQKNLIAMTAMKKRYANVYRRAKDFIGSNEFGKAIQLQMFRVSSFGWDNASPRRDCLLDYCVHNIDLCAFLFGQVRSVHAWTVNRQHYQVALHFTSGAMGVFTVVERAGGPNLEDVELTGSQGWMSIHDQSRYRIHSGGKVREIGDANFTTAGVNGGNVTGHAAELAAFARAIRTGERPASHIEESYQTMRIHDAIVRAVSTGDAQAV